MCKRIALCSQAGQEDDPVLEEALGFESFSQGQARLGWLMNLNEVPFFSQPPD